MDEGTLGEKAGEAIGALKLPTRRPDRMWGGPGGGANCAICRGPVKRDEVEFELEFARNGEDSRQDTFHVHVRCFTIWERDLDGSAGAAPDSMARDGIVGVQPRHHR